MIYNEDDFLQLSGLQHFMFCRRQWALIHIEQQWIDNLRTTEGELMHEKAHDRDFSESRKDLYVVRALRVFSPTLGISGECDVVEFHRSEKGISITGKEGLWLPFPVEYKHGEPKENDCDRLQLCAQAMCLEEMLCCKIANGALFYGQTRRRQIVEFTEELRQQVKDAFSEMHQLYKRGYTPKVKPSKSCNACSLKERCIPALCRNKKAIDYLRKAMEDDL